MRYLLNFSIVICLILPLLAGCNNSADCKKAPTWNEDIQQKCLAQLKGLLKDPDSYQSISWKVVNNYPKYIALKKRFPEWDGKFYKWAFINEYRAKNSFGGYNFGTAYFLVDSLENIEYSDEEYLPSYIK
jgi:hypothetical protein